MPASATPWLVLHRLADRRGGSADVGHGLGEFAFATGGRIGVKSAGLGGFIQLGGKRLEGTRSSLLVAFCYGIPHLTLLGAHGGDLRLITQGALGSLARTFGGGSGVWHGWTG